MILTINPEGTLFRCPRCGQQPKILYWYDGAAKSWCMIKCTNPMCSTPPEGYPYGDNLSKVIAEWNRRAEAFKEKLLFN